MALALALTACGNVQDNRRNDLPDAGSGAPGDDANPGARCDGAASFGAPRALDAFGPAATGNSTLSLTSDELIAVVSEGNQLRAARRDGFDDPFPIPDAAVFANINGSNTIEAPSITADGLNVYYLSEGFVFHAERFDTDSQFATPSAITADGATLLPAGFAIASSGQTLYFVDPGDGKLHAASASDAKTFSLVRTVSAMTVSNPVLDPNEARLYYGSGGEIFVTDRASLDDDFLPGTKLDDVNSNDFEAPLFVGADDCALFFKSNRPGHTGSGDMWETRRE